MILVTGATGANGTELHKLLSARRVPARAMVRSTGTAAAIAAPPGIEIAAGDLDDNASLDRALRGIERAFLLTNFTDRADRLCRGCQASRRAPHRKAEQRHSRSP